MTGDVWTCGAVENAYAQCAQCGTVFWARKAVLLVDFLPVGTTINADSTVKHWNNSEGYFRTGEEEY